MSLPELFFLLAMIAAHAVILVLWVRNVRRERQRERHFNPCLKTIGRGEMSEALHECLTRAEREAAPLFVVEHGTAHISAATEARAKHLILPERLRRDGFADEGLLRGLVEFAVILALLVSLVAFFAAFDAPRW